jgi:hypothetical protein
VLHKKVAVIKTWYHTPSAAMELKLVHHPKNYLHQPENSLE